MRQLSFEELRAVTVGALRVWEEDGHVCFSKLSDAQFESISAAVPGVNPAALATTGVRLDLRTNASCVEYTTTTTGSYELKVDGLLTSVVRAEAGRLISYELPQDGREHRVTLHLPSHGEPGGLSYLALSDGATLHRHEFDRKFLFCGDSITQGWHTELDTLSYAYLVSDHFNAESVIQGIGGETYQTYNLAPMDFSPDVIFIAYGTNDADQRATLEDVRAHCEAYLDKLSELFPGVPVYVITPPWRLDADRPRPWGRVELAADVIATVARERGLTVLDAMTMIPHDSRFFADPLHPNDLGFCLYAHGLIRALSGCLGSPRHDNA